MANCVEPDQTPQNAASDQELHGLLMPVLPSARATTVFLLVAVVHTFVQAPDVVRTMVMKSQV